MYQSKFMERAVSLSREALDKPGTLPYGAVIVMEGKIVGEGLNFSHARFDPTSHGEIEAIRDACRNLERVDLSGCEIYTSCEPCPLCVAAITMTGISSMYYGVSLEEAAQIWNRFPPRQARSTDIETLRRESGSTIEERAIPVQQANMEEAAKVLQAWGEQTHRG
jgi:tRNA(Arg) A34 adenosine deaminase TadA